VEVFDAAFTPVDLLIIVGLSLDSLGSNRNTKNTSVAQQYMSLIAAYVHFGRCVAMDMCEPT
jgi:hypothetical protein